MSKCMTIADETVDTKDICIDITPKEIVEFILEEALLSVVIVSDKGCSRIGDSNITAEYRQQYDQISIQKDFEQVEPSQAQPTANKGSNLSFRESLERAVPVKGNLEKIIDSFVKKEEEKNKPVIDCQVITEEILADNKLQVKNGQIHLEKNKSEKSIAERTRQEYFDKKDVIKDEKIEIEYFNKGELNKIYVPLNLASSSNIDGGCGSKQKEVVPEKWEEENKLNELTRKENSERPFKPLTTEELRESTLQVWENENSSLVGRLDGDMLSQQEEVVKIMEELSSVQRFPESFADPNRPRACAFGEEEVKKMIKEIEDIHFTQSHTNSEDSVVSYFLDGQGDAEIESDRVEKSQNESSLTYVKNEGKIGQKVNIIPSTNTVTQIDQLSSKITTNADSKENCLNISNDETRTYVEEKNSLMNFDSNFNIEGQSEKINHKEVKMTEKKSGLLYSGSASLKECVLNEQFFPKSTSMSENTESLNKSKQVEFTSTGPDLAPDSDAKLIEEKPSRVIKETQNTYDTQDILLVSNHQTQQGTVSWNEFKWGSNEAICTLSLNSFLEEKHWERLVVDYNLLSEEAEEKIESNDAENFLQELHSHLDESKSNFEVIQNGEDTNLNSEDIKERAEEPLIYAERNVENIEKLEDRILETKYTEADTEGKGVMDGASSDFTKTTLSVQESQKSLNCEDGTSNTKSDQEPLVSSITSQTQVNEQLMPENEPGEASETLVSASQKFNLHSQKMYFRPYHEPAGHVPNELNLTESEETFIDMSENVIQVIEPPENSADEDSNVISFSFLPETSNLKSSFPNVDTKSELSLEKSDISESGSATKKIYSGMTTIGPIKNTDYDPKDLVAPEVDYGKMTRITSSRQLARDMGLLNSEINTAISVKIIEEDDSDENASLNIEEDHLDRTSLINRDIASLTKVQKIREVMSYQTKPEEDFEDEESLPRPRLDLKDVESMTDERYKLTDVSIPLLSFEIGDRNLDAEKELIENMGLVISGLTNACFYDEDVEDDTEIQRNYSSQEKNFNNAVESSNNDSINNHNSKTEFLKAEEKTSKYLEKQKSEVELAEVMIKESTHEEVLEIKYQTNNGKDSPREDFENVKYTTLGNVFRKASSKFMRKDGELCRRNSKSLPRDANKITTANSIRSILDDCQSSASNLLKKSCSLLKNTESIFKSISQSMVSSERNSDTSATQKKLSPSESDVSTIERKFSGFFKKEDFVKTKNFIKSKVEKTLKNSDTGTFSVPEPEISSGKKDLQIVARNEQNLRIDRIENFKKLLPKSPLVYKSQFVKSQMNFQIPSESEAAVNPSTTQQQTDGIVNGFSAEDITDSVPEKEREILPKGVKRSRSNIPRKSNDDSSKCGDSLISRIHELRSESQEEPQSISIYSQENVQWIIKQDGLQTSTDKNSRPEQPDFIVMETIQGLPASDLESPSSKKENLIVENIEKNTSKNADLKIEASNSLQILTESCQDVAPRFREVDDEKTVTKTPSERKIKTKKKKFTARFRSFWCSAFGRAKTPHKKGDLS